MEMRKLGRAGLEVSALGYGCMGLSAAYGAPPPHAEAIAIMRAAFDGGVTLFDTAEAYGPFSNESLLGEAVPFSPLGAGFLTGKIDEKTELAPTGVGAQIGSVRHG